MFEAANGADVPRTDGASALGFEHGPLLEQGRCFSLVGSTSCTSSCLPVLMEHNTLTQKKQHSYKTNPKTAGGHTQLWQICASGTVSHHSAWDQAPQESPKSLHLRSLHPCAMLHQEQGFRLKSRWCMGPRDFQSFGGVILLSLSTQGL